MDETPKESPTMVTVRFYFTLTLQLAKDDPTKISDVETLPLFICLNTASMWKEKYLKELEEQKKLERKMRQMK